MFLQSGTALSLIFAACLLFAAHEAPDAAGAVILTSAGQVADDADTALIGSLGVDTATIDGRTYAVVASLNENGIQIIDVTNRASPTPVGQVIDNGGLLLDGAFDVSTVAIGPNTYAVVASFGDSGIEIIDITTPSLPVPVGRVADNGGLALYRATGVSTVTIGPSTYAVVAALDDNGVQIIDITSPESPTPISRVVDDETLALGAAFDVSTTTIGASTYAVVTSRDDNGVQIIDITDPHSPAAAGQITDTPSLELAGSRRLAVTAMDSSTYAVVAAQSDDGVQIIDITDPHSPVAAGRVADTGLTRLASAYGVSTVTIGASTYAIVTSIQDRGVQIIDITDPASPDASVSVGSGGRLLLERPLAVTAAAANAAGSAAYAYVVSGYGGESGLQILRLDVPPQVAITTAEPDPTSAHSVEFQIRFDQTVPTIQNLDKSAIAIRGIGMSGIAENYTDFSHPRGAGHNTFLLNLPTYQESRDGTIILTVRKDAVTNAAGVGNEAATFSIRLDRFGPGAPAISRDGFAGSAATNPVSFRVNFTEAIDPATFTESDIHATDGTVSDIATSDNRTFTFQVNNPLNRAVLRVGMPAGAVTDVAGNPSTADSNTLDVLADRTIVPVGQVHDTGTSFLGRATAVSTAVIGTSTYAVVSSIHPDDGVQIIDITAPSSPSLAGGITDTTGNLRINPFGVSTAVIGTSTYAVVPSVTSSTLDIINITDPYSPELAGSIGDSAEALLGGASAVATAAIDGKTYAVVAASSDHGVQIIDITNPSSPMSSRSGSIRDDGDLKLRGVGDVSIAAIGPHTYAVVTSDADHGVQIINITDPYSPSPAGQIGDGAMLALESPSGVSTAAIGPHAYAIVASPDDDTVQIINITDPYSPSPAGLIRDGDGRLAGAADVYATSSGSRTYAVVAATDGRGIHVADITDPASPDIIGHLIDDGTTLLENPIGISVASINGAQYAIVTSFREGVEVLRLDLPPSATISSAETAGPTSASPIPITVTFTEPVTFREYEAAAAAGSVPGGITATGATLHDFVRVNAATYTVNAVPAGDGRITVDVAANAAASAGYIGNAEADTFRITYDATRPSATISSAETAGPTSASPIPITVTFTEPVTFREYEAAAAAAGSVPGGITATGATLHDFVRVNAATYTVNAVPAGDGTVVVTVAAGAAADAASNANAAATFDIEYSRIVIGRPSITLAAGTTDPTGAGTVPMRVDFGQVIDPSTFTPPDVVVNGGTVTDDITTSDNQTFSFDVANPRENARLSAYIPAGSVSYMNYTQIKDSNTVTVFVSRDAPSVSIGSAGPVGNVPDDDATRLRSPFDVSITSMQGRIYAVASSFDDSTLEIIDITDPYSPVPVGQVIDGPERLLNNAIGVDTMAVGGKTYAVAVSFVFHGIQMVDITDPYSPVPMGKASYDAPSQGAYGVSVAEMAGGRSYAVVTDVNNGGMQLFDITDPSSPSHVGGMPGDPARPHDGTHGVDTVQISGRTYAVVTAQNDNAVWIIDITDPSSPSVAGNLTDSESLVLGRPSGVSVTGIGSSTYAVIASYGEGGVQLVDITNPESPSPAGQISDDGTLLLGGAYDVDTITLGASTYAFVAANGENGVQILDITNPAMPSPIASVMNSDVAPLNGSLGIDAVEIGGAIYAAVSAPSADGVGIIRFDPPLPGSGTTPLQAIPITVTFSSDTAGFGPGDISTTGASLENFAKVTDRVYTADAIPDTDGPVTINVPANVTADSLGRGNTAALPFWILADAVPPGVAIGSSGPDPTNATSIPVSVAFTEPVTGFDRLGMRVTGGILDAFGGSGASYTATVTPTVNGTVTMRVAAGAAHDATGKPNTASDTLAIVHDRVPPTVEISSTAGSHTNSTTVPVTITFGEPVTGFGPDDITAADGTDLSGLANASGSAYTVNASRHGDGVVSLAVSHGAARDAAGNPSQAASFKATVDTVSPSPAVTSPESGRIVTAPADVPLFIAFDEPVSGFGDRASDIGIAGRGHVIPGSIIMINETHYNATVRITGGGHTAIQIPAGAARDAAGNPSDPAPAALAIESDPSMPQVTITYPAQPGPTNANPIPITIGLSEPLTDPWLASMDATNATLNTITGSGLQYMVNATPTVNGTVTVSVLFNSGEGGSSVVVKTLAIEYDGVRPRASFASAASTPTNANPIQVNITFSEPVTGLDLADIASDGARVADLVRISGSEYTVNAFPTRGGSVLLGVDHGAAHDAAGNPNTQAIFTTVSDRTRPSFTVTSPASPGPTSTNPIPVTVDFDVPVTGFGAANITASNADLANFTGSGSTYTVAAIPTVDSGNITVFVDVRPSGEERFGTVHALIVEYDGVRPSAAVTSAGDGPSTSVRSLPLLITFGEPVDGLAQDGVVVTGPASVTVNSPPLEDGGGGNGYLATYNATLDFTGEGTATVTVAAGAARDAAGNPSTASDTLGITYNATRPAVAVTSPVLPGPTSTNPIPVAVDFGVPVTGFGAADITASNADLANFTGSGSTYTVAAIPTVDSGNITVFVATRPAEGEQHGRVYTLVVEYDGVRPSAAVTSAEDGPSTGVQSLPLTISFDEPVTGFDAADITASAGVTVSGFAQTAGASEYTATADLSGLASNSTVTVDVAAGVATDAAGNGNTAAPRFSITYVAPG